MTDSNEVKKIQVMVYERAAKVEKGGTIDSIDIQTSGIDKFASENGFKIVEHYIDDGFSGDVFKLPALRQLAREIVKIDCKIIIVYSWNRISTNYFDFVFLRNRFNKAGIEIFSIHMVDSSIGL